MTIRIDPYKQASKSAKALSRYTGILRATHKQVKKHGTFDIVLNWGNSERRFNSDYINNPEAVAIASDKLRSCRKFREANVNQPAYSTEKSVALGWLEEGSRILARQLTRACGGRGIVSYEPAGDEHDTNTNGRPRPTYIRHGWHRHNRGSAGNYVGGGARGVRPSDGGAGGSNTRYEGGGGTPAIHANNTREYTDSICSAPLYTRYVKKADEYRLHVFDGRVIDIQQKRKRKDIPNEEIDYQIRNTASGWVYCRDDVDCPSSCSDIAIRAVAALGLDFGAVDIGYNRHTETPCVYEVNTAPGLEGTTLTRYQEALERRLPQIKRGTYAKRRAYGGGGTW